MLPPNDINTKAFSIVAPLSALSRRTRLYKLAIFLQKNGVTSLEHVGWERIEGERKEFAIDFDINKKIILSGGGYGGPKIKWMYFTWMMKLFFKSFSFKKDQTVWALGFESAFPLLLASKIKGFKLYFDDADRFSMLLNFPSIIKKILQVLERYTSRNVYMHLIPVRERYDFESDRFKILPNMPSETEIIKAKDIYKEKQWIKADIVININGWLGDGRGMKTILETSKLLNKKNIAFILAGKLDCVEAKELSKLRNVQYIGEVSNAEALSSYLASDFVFTYYDPSSIINTFAASNKWGDALKTGVGVIVNTEVSTANYLREANACLSFEYLNHEGLANKIIELLNDPAILKDVRKNINVLSDKFGYFEQELNELFNSNNE